MISSSTAFLDGRSSYKFTVWKIISTNDEAASGDNSVYNDKNQKVSISSPKVP